jgi:large subunit ribosomal protein L4
MKISIKDTKGKNQGELEVKFALVEDGKGTQAVHDTVVAYRAAQRMGTACTKNVGEVAGTNKKPWRQKGTGRARAGMTSSPLWRGGGKTFPNSPDENFSHKVNRKMFRAGLCSILSKLAQDGRICVVDGLTVEQPRTKLLAQKLKAMGLGSVMIITETMDKNLYLASRNLRNVMVVEPRYADPVSLIFFDKVVVTRPAIAKLEQMWGQA